MWIKNWLKRVASRLSRSTQNELKRIQFSRQIRSNTFITDEAEYGRLEEWVSEGDWVIDVGANIGHYTLKLSNLVGKSGRVIAFEPVPTTFELLAANCAKTTASNITLINAAASDKSELVSMSIPTFDSGLDNFYMAHISDSADGLRCMTLTIDSILADDRVSLVKVDAEGHELPVLRGMENLMRRHKPILIVEDNSKEIRSYLEQFGYQSTYEAGSSNRVYAVPK